MRAEHHLGHAHLAEDAVEDEQGRLRLDRHPPAVGREVVDRRHLVPPVDPGELVELVPPVRVGHHGLVVQAEQVAVAVLAQRAHDPLQLPGGAVRREVGQVPGDVVLQDGAPVARQGAGVVQAPHEATDVVEHGLRSRAHDGHPAPCPTRPDPLAPARRLHGVSSRPRCALPCWRESQPVSIGAPSRAGHGTPHGLSPLRRDRGLDSRVPPLRGDPREGPRRADPAHGVPPRSPSPGRLAEPSSSPPSASRSSWAPPPSTCVAARHRPPPHPSSRRPPARSGRRPRRVDGAASRGRAASPIAPPPEVADAALRAASGRRCRPGDRGPPLGSPAGAGAAHRGGRARGRGPLRPLPRARAGPAGGRADRSRRRPPRGATLRRRGRTPRTGPGRRAGQPSRPQGPPRPLRSRPATGPPRRARRASLLARAPSDAEAARGLAYALVRQDRSREAIEVLAAFLDQHPDPETRALLERFRRDQGSEAPLDEARLAHFHVRYDGDAHEDVGREILRVLDRHYATLVRTFGHQPAAPIPVILLSRAELLRRDRRAGLVGRAVRRLRRPRAPPHRGPDHLARRPTSTTRSSTS